MGGMIVAVRSTSRARTCNLHPKLFQFVDAPTSRVAIGMRRSFFCPPPQTLPPLAGRDYAAPPNMCGVSPQCAGDGAKCTSGASSPTFSLTSPSPAPLLPSAWVNQSNTTAGMTAFPACTRNGCRHSHRTKRMNWRCAKRLSFESIVPNALSGSFQMDGAASPGQPCHCRCDTPPWGHYNCFPLYGSLVPSGSCATPRRPTARGGGTPPPPPAVLHMFR